MWHFRTWFSRHGGVGVTVGLDDLRVYVSITSKMQPPPKKIHSGVFLLVLRPSGRVLPVMCKATGFTEMVALIAEVFIPFLCRPVSWPHWSFSSCPFLLLLSHEFSPHRRWSSEAQSSASAVWSAAMAPVQGGSIDLSEKPAWQTSPNP